MATVIGSGQLGSTTMLLYGCNIKIGGLVSILGGLEEIIKNKEYLIKEKMLSQLKKMSIAFDSFDWIIHLRTQNQLDCEYLNRLKQELSYSLSISLIFNVSNPILNRKTGFSKSGFIGRTAKRRKGR